MLHRQSRLESNRLGLLVSVFLLGGLLVVESARPQTWHTGSSIALMVSEQWGQKWSGSAPESGSWHSGHLAGQSACHTPWNNSPARSAARIVMSIFIHNKMSKFSITPGKLLCPSRKGSELKF